MTFSKKYCFDFRGDAVYLYTLKNDHGMELGVLNLGASIVQLIVPDRFDRPTDIVLGYADLNGYMTNPFYLGSTVGRYANRIREGRFNWLGKSYQLEQNDGPNHLHGGSDGFQHRIWQQVKSDKGLKLQLHSPDGDAGYPGELTASVEFILDNCNSLKLIFEAHSKDVTFANLTNHSYFNLDGEGNELILDQVAEMSSRAFLEADQTMIPTGRFIDTRATAFDFEKAKPIGRDIGKNEEQINLAGGYDHCFLCKQEAPFDARVFSQETGIRLSFKTDYPGFQFYSGNFLDNSILGKSGQTYPARSGFCLESQFFPDAPNQPDFDLDLVEPGHPLVKKTCFSFDLIAD